MSAAGRMNPALGPAGVVPVGERLVGHFRRIAEDLPADCRRLLLLAADQGDDPALVWHGAELEGIDPAALVPAEAAGLIELQPTVRFQHGVMRSAVLSTAQPGNADGSRAARSSRRPPEDADQRA